MSNVYLIAGDNTSLLSRKADEVVASRRTIHPDTDVIRVNTVPDLADAITMPSLLANHQIIVFQASLTAAQQKEIPDLLNQVATDTELVLALTKPSAPVKKAVQALQGQVHEVVGKSHKDTTSVLLANTSVNFTAAAKALLAEHVGQEVEQVPPLIDLLASTLGPGSRVDADDLRPFLSDKGSVPVWELNDAIDAANPARALSIVDRLLWSNTPYALMSVVTAHVERLFRVSQLGFKDEVEAAEFFGMKGSTYPAKKAIMTASRYGASLPALVELTAKAGNDMRGASGVPARIVLEILVGRLCTYPRRR